MNEMAHENVSPVQKKLFIIDLMPFLYRGHFVFLRNPRVTSTGLTVSALIGFVNGVTAILAEHRPTHVVLAMDPTGPTFRHQTFPAYKAQREKMPEDLASNIPFAFEVAEALGIPVVRVDGFEADDVMGTLAARGAQDGFEVFLATPDKDAAQLVSEKVRLFRPSHGKEEAEIFDVEKVKAHWHLSSPAQMIDYLALAGDASDNIPGVKGVGEKTAVSLLSQYGTLENILSHASELKGKLSEKVAASQEEAKLSKFLTTIRTDVPLSVDWESFRLKPYDRVQVLAVCQKFELHQLARRLLGDVPQEQLVQTPVQTTQPNQTHLVQTPEDMRVLIQHLEVAPRIACATQTVLREGSPRLVGAQDVKLVGLKFATSDHELWHVIFSPHIPIAHQVSPLVPIFADPTKTWIAHDAKFLLTQLAQVGLEITSTVHDTMLAQAVLDASSRASQEAPESESPLVSFVRDGQLRARLGEVHARGALEQCEEPLVPILIEMEQTGVKIDTTQLRAYGQDLDREIFQIIQEIHELGGVGINLDSPRQLGDFLFEKLHLLPGEAKKTQTGQYATDEKTLQKLVSVHPIVQKILDYRACAKLKSTYVDKLPLCVSPHDGRIHTTFAQVFTETGRLSSSHPNMQNLPIRTKRGQFIRAAVVARDENHRLLSADYSQIELRLMAALSGDESMLNAFAQGADIHRETAARVYNMIPALVSDELRSKCKMVNFGIIYGISSFGLSQRLNISRKEASNLIEVYFNKYPKIRAFMDASIAKARETGYATTLMGRRRHLPDITSRNATVRQAAERDAINTPVQGSAADLIKLAMVHVHQALKERQLKTKMILQIHDELLFDVPCDEVDEVKEIVRDKMTHALSLGVPLDVSIGVGSNWLEAH